MIPKKYARDMLIGRKCRTTEKMHNGAGAGLSPGTLCTIKDVVRGKGITIETEPCSCCGQFAYITRVQRKSLDFELEVAVLE